MAEMCTLEDLLTVQRKEKKELVAKTQKMKHSVPKGDKKKKKEVTAEITQLLAELELKHENEIMEFEKSAPGTANSDQKSEVTGTHSEELYPVNLSCGESKVNKTCDKEEEKIIEGVPRLSKAQKRRNKKAMLEKERNLAIAAQELENRNSLRHLESEEIKEKLAERNLTIHEVPSDGNCLYKAVEHQLSLLSLKQMTVEELRESTSKYMLSHMEDYMPFLTCPETGDVLTEEQYVRYCEDIVNTCAWGGHIEIQVLSNICEVPMEVIQAQGPSIFAGNENSNPKLILSYHRHVYGLGEHYNSVIPLIE